MKSNITKRTTGILLASAVAVGAIGVIPKLPVLVAGDTALADPVRVNAPQAPDFADVVEAVTPAVVSVRVESDEMQPDSGYRFDRRGGSNDFRLPPALRDHPFFRDGPFNFDDQDRQDGDRRQGRRGSGDNKDRSDRPHRYGMAQGSGFFVSDDGYIVTNQHVIDKGAKFTVVTDDGTEYDATLVGADSRTDLAVLKVDADKKFTYVKFANEEPRVGQWVVAIGNPFGLGGTVTAGIVSAHDRNIRSNRYDDLIQIDAAVNKGNSGGPAFNMNGEVIGINNVIFSPNGGNVGIAFAIPATSADRIVTDLIKNGEVVRGWLGVRIQPVTADIAESVGLDAKGGAIVTEPQTDSPAVEAGIHSGDVILAVNGSAVKDPRELARKIGGFAPESSVTVTVWRDGKSRDIEVKLGKLADDTIVASSGETSQSNVARVGLALESTPDGVVVTDVEPGSGAEDKDIQPGDIVLSVNGEDVGKPEDVAKIVRQATELDRKAALFQIKRDEDVMFVAIPIKRS
jgi:serine protease Do